MKIDRLLGILNILSRAEIVTAPELAERFEVSRRTINRDIEDLCLAGIPVVTKQGSGGGIYIQENYKLDKSLLKSQELTDIVSALKGLESVSRNRNIKELLNKIVSDTDEERNDRVIHIDLASFYKDSLSNKIDSIKEAVLTTRIIEFTYYNINGKEVIQAEPYQIIYKWSDWYLCGYCLNRNDFRLFKLNRLWDLQITQDLYEKREIPDDKMDFGTHLTDEYRFSAEFDSSVKYRLVEEYGPNSFTETEKHTLLFNGKYTNREFIISWLLGFGDKVKVNEPSDLVDEIRTQTENTAKKYRS